jgi:hypothetical protein
MIFCATSVWLSEKIVFFVQMGDFALYNRKNQSMMLVDAEASPFQPMWSHTRNKFEGVTHDVNAWPTLCGVRQ